MDIQDQIKPFDKDNIDLVIYHHPCQDGFGAAFCVWHYYKTKFGLDRTNQIRFKPASHSKISEDPQDKFYDKFVDKNILIVDFSYKLKILQKIIQKCSSLMILDHHKSAQEDLESIDTNLKIFDMNRSGAVITWNYFFGNTTPVPKFILYIQDRDLWTNVFLDSGEFSTFFNEIKFNFELWEKYLDDKVCDIAIESGRSWLDYKTILVNRAANKASRVIQIINNVYCVVAYANSPEFRSDIGATILDVHKLVDFSCLWSYDLNKNTTNFSLRSNNSRFDVKEIAVANNGGGHRNAAGITLAGVCGCLPYELVKPTYIDLIEHVLVRTIYDELIERIKTSYIIFDCTELGKKFWRHPDKMFVDLVKRKNRNAEMIVFQIKKNVSGKFLVQSYHILLNDLFVNDDGVSNRHLFDTKTLSLKLDSIDRLNDVSDYNVMFSNTYNALKVLHRSL